MNRRPEGPGRAPRDWTRGPARDFAAAVLLLLSAGALAYALASGSRPIAPAERSAADAPRAEKINLNTATQDELRLLPRIGPALARRIAEDRERNGPFASPEDLQRVRGIGPRTVQAVRHLVTAEPAR
jgi:competence protein ComEA